MIAISLSRGTDMGVTLEDTRVMFLRAGGGPRGIRAAGGQAARFARPEVLRHLPGWGVSRVRGPASA